MSTDCPARYGAQLTLPVRTRRAAGNGKLIRFEDLGARLVASYPDFILFYFIFTYKRRKYHVDVWRVSSVSTPAGNLPMCPTVSVPIELQKINLLLTTGNGLDYIQIQLDFGL